MVASHRELEHTADLGLEILADSEVELLLEGARALVERIVGPLPHGPEVERRIALHALDGEDRLVRWLNEVIVLAVHEGFAVRDGRLLLGSPGELEGTLRGVALAPADVHAELKSATYHELLLERGADGTWRARVVIDV